VVNHGGTTCGSLWGSYETVLETQKSIKEKQAIEKQIMEWKKLGRTMSEAYESYCEFAAS
jgi:hypothetical protein